MISVENTYVKLRNFNTLLKALFIISADYESILPSASDNKIEGSNISYTKNIKIIWLQINMY